jgi:hypothetical protein
MPVAISAIALGVDASLWSSNKNSAQGAADDAALSAVSAAAAGNSAARISADVIAVAAQDGFQNGSGGVTVNVNNPPTSGSHQSDSNAFEIIVSAPQKVFFSRLLGSASTATGRSVALLTSSTPVCLLSLDTTGAGAITESGGSTTITAPGCIVAANSKSSSALNLLGGASLTAQEVILAGNYATSGGSQVHATTIKTATTATMDPYASLSVPSFSGCLYPSGYSGNTTTTLSPGVYCGSGITISGGAVTLNPGVYIMNGGSFKMTGGSASGANVSIIMTSTSGTYGSFSVNGSSALQISAPSSGSMQGVAIYVDRNAPPSGNDQINGGSSTTITGSIYAPSQTVTYSGGSSGSSCSQLIARDVTFSGSSTFGDTCGSLRVPGMSSSSNTGVPVE